MAVTSSRTPTGASSTSAAAGSTRASTACAGCPTRPGCQALQDARARRREPDLAALDAEITGFLDQAAVAEGIGAKLNRLLFGFLEAEVLAQAMRAAEVGIDPTPLLDVVATVLRMYADGLDRPSHGTD